MIFRIGSSALPARCMCVRIELMLNAQDARVSLRTNEYGETVRVGAELTALSIETLAGDPVNVEYVESFVLGGAVEDTDLRPG